MTREEAKAYALKILKEGGASDDDATRITSAFDNEKFFNGFVPRPEVDRSLQSERQRYDEFKKRNEYLEGEWYPAAKQTYERAKQIEGQLAKYQQLYGDIDPNDPNAVNRAANSTGLDESKVLELLESRLSTALSARDSATLDLMDIREDYMDKMKKRLPMNEFEQHVARERKAGRNDSLKALYKDWIQPEVEKLNEQSIEARLKAKYEEGQKDFASRHKIPVDGRPKEAHVLFDQRDRDDKSSTRKSGKDAFLEVLNDPDPDTVRARYPVS